MRIQTTSRKGNYNFLDPSQVSISTTFRIIDPPADLPLKYPSANITTEYEVEENDPTEVALMIREYLKGIFISTSRNDNLAFADYLDAHRYELELGNWEYSIERLRKEIAQKQERLDIVLKCKPEQPTT